MNLTPQSCPQCGSPLQVAADGRAGICPQCRTTFTLQLDVKINNLASLVRSGMEYLRQGDFNNAEEQSRKIIDLDASRGEGWLLKAATTFDIAQADQVFTTGLRAIGEAERQEFALIFKPLALYVWKKANSMLVRDAGRPGMSRAARQHYEIQAKAAQLYAFAIELFPLSGWQKELAKYLPTKAWDEYTEAERIDLFDMLTRFDSKASSDLDAFIAQRERLINRLAEKLPEEQAALFGPTEDHAASARHPAASAVQPYSVTLRPRARLGCGGWAALIVILVFLIGIVGSLVTGDKKASSQEQAHHRLTPHEFGWAMGRELLKSASTDSGSGGMVIFAQGCRAENPTVKTYTNAAYQQFLNGLMDAYTEWRRNGYVVLDTEIRDRPPSVVARANAPTNSPSPEPTSSAVSQASEKSPLGDLVVQRPQNDEIWLACTDGSRRPKQLCEHDWRSGQVSFSPDEHWIVVTDGGGPGSSMGTTLRAFYRRTQNLYREMEDAGIEDRAAEAALRQHNAPQGAELDHTYAEVEGWSSDGGILNVNVWGHGAGYGHLDPTKIEIDMSMTRANSHRPDPEAATIAPVRVPPQHTVAPETAKRETERAAKNQADAELNAAYTRLMAASGPSQQKQLRNEERTWLGWRDKEADLIARNSITPANDYETGRMHVLADLTEQRTRVLKTALEHLGASVPSAANPPRTASAPTEQRSSTARPIDEGRPEQGNRRSMLSRVYTLPELKTLVGTRPSGAGLRGDFVVVRREGSQILLQSRADMQRWGITGTTNGQEDVYLGHTFVTVNCSKDMSRLINGKLVTIPAEQALQIISVSKNSQGQINVEASF